MLLTWFRYLPQVFPLSFELWHFRLSSHTVFILRVVTLFAVWLTSSATLFTTKRVLHFGLVLFVAGRWEATSCSALLSMLSYFSAHVPECLFLSCCKTLGAPLLDNAIFYIPSPSDVGIVFLLRLTTVIYLRHKIYCVVEEHSAPEIVWS